MTINMYQTHDKCQWNCEIMMDNKCIIIYITRRKKRNKPNIIEN